MRKAFFPHMEWAKAQSRRPAKVPLGFSGALHPRGEALKEHASGDAALQSLVGRRYGVPADHVYLAGGTSLANFIALAALADPGETVLVETPRYASLAEIPRGLGCRVVDVPRCPSGRLGPLPAAGRLLVVTNPHNPTGRLLDAADWGALERFARRGVVLVDEVYRDLQEHPGRVAAARHPRFLTTGSLTKAYGLGALRLGWVLGAPDLLREIARVDNLVSVQVATPSLLLARRLWPRLDGLRRRAVRHVDGNLGFLRASGLRFVEPQAGLTALVDVGDGDAVADLLAKEGVAVARGSFFGAPAAVRVFLGAPPALFRRGIRALCRVTAGRVARSRRSGRRAAGDGRRRRRRTWPAARRGPGRP
ncbi:MAG: pyridoxal phosphate-dependent aminotransferase [Planctomycetota bacterium]